MAVGRSVFRPPVVGAESYWRLGRIHEVRSLSRSLVPVRRASSCRDHQWVLLGHGTTTLHWQQHHHHRGRRLFCSREPRSRDDGGSSFVLATTTEEGKSSSSDEKQQQRGHEGPHTVVDENASSSTNGNHRPAAATGGGTGADDDESSLEGKQPEEKTVLGIVTDVVVETVEVVAQTTADVAEVVAQTTADVAEAVAEKVEEAAQTVSSVGEIVPPVEDHPVVDTSSALKTVSLWVSAAVAFGGAIGLTQGGTKASEYFAGYILEQSLSIDNLFVFVLIFDYFRVPLQYQSRVLTYGLAGAVVFRAVMITAGVASIERFGAVNLVFAGFLLFTAYKILRAADQGDGESSSSSDLSDNLIVKTCQRLIPVTPAYDGNKFFTVVDGAQRATPLFLTVAILELSDVAFAVDSIPAVFGVTRDPFIIFSSNVFAILGLRSLYTVISSSMAELEYLQPAVGVVLGFIGTKMVAEYCGVHVPTEVSLGVVAAVLGAGVALSLRSRASGGERDDHED